MQQWPLKYQQGLDNRASQRNGQSVLHRPYCFYNPVLCLEMSAIDA